MKFVESSLMLPFGLGGFGLRRCLRPGWLAFLVAVGGMLASLDALAEPDGNVDDSAMIVERASARWKALVDGDLAAAYAFATPAYRSSNPLRLYVSRFGQQVRWTGARVMDVAVEQDVATVRVLVSYATLDPAGGMVVVERPLRETWVRVDGAWWHGTP